MSSWFVQFGSQSGKKAHGVTTESYPLDARPKSDQNPNPASQCLDDGPMLDLNDFFLFVQRHRPETEQESDEPTSTE